MVFLRRYLGKEARGKRTEVGGQWGSWAVWQWGGGLESGVRGRWHEVRGKRTEVRRQRSAVKRQRSENIIIVILIIIIIDGDGDGEIGLRLRSGLRRR